ncbi:hypothetical protein O181_061897 [Austropuccinia psidii MF-1]|uniref:Uncharacterized protein n=1 Tax=Austropuccinia psidii MF-1 TaxID=1389203 RepID=A0A9Q3ERB4_9BASI|nr:hypothetical protein [Austropuccinia psidii MF-1]
MAEHRKLTRTKKIKLKYRIEDSSHSNNKTDEENIEIREHRNSTLEEEFRTISQIKVVGPRNPTIINSNVDKLNILPYQRRIKAYIT